MNMEDYESEYGYEDEILSLVQKHQEKAMVNTVSVTSFLEVADEREFANSEFIMESYFEGAILHANSAKYLLKFMKLLDAISAGYGAFIKCPACESHKVDLQIGSKVIKQSCVNCDHEWDFPLK